jgi:hypothetical protein
MAASIFLPGETYYLRYSEWNADPSPYLYVVYSDREFTEGWNIHYLPNIRFHMPLENYKRVNHETWKKAYENMKANGMFRGFTDILEKASEGPRAKGKFRALVQLISKRHPWAMESYRRYHTNKLRILK